MHIAELKAILGAVIIGTNCNEINSITIATDLRNSIESRNKYQKCNSLLNNIIERTKESSKLVRFSSVPSY